MIFKNIKIVTKLGAIFGIIVLLVVVSGYISISYMKQLTNSTTKIYNHPFAVSRAILKIDGNIIRIHRSMKDIVLSKNKEEISKIENTINKLENTIISDFKVVEERFLGDKYKVDIAMKSFLSWKSIRDEVIELMYQDKTKKAIRITKNKGASHIKKLSKDINKFIQFADDKAGSFLTEANNARDNALIFIFFLIIFLTSIITLFATFFTKNLTKSLTTAINTSNELAKGNLSTKISILGNDEISHLLRSMKNLAGKLQKASKINNKMLWKITGQSELSESIRGELTLKKISRYVIRYLCKRINGKIGAFYIVNGEDITLYDSYAFVHRKELSNKFKIGEGLVGEAVREKKMIILENAPNDFFKIKSGLGSDKPKNVVALPFINNDEVVAIAEIGNFEEFTSEEIEFLESITDTVAIVISSASARAKTEELLKTSQSQKKELESQKQEIEISNKQMKVQQEELQAINEELQAQQEELRVSNEELGEKTKSLERQKAEILKSNEKLEEARTEIMRKAKELEVSSKYKSEFLANMSHELRTPLNSLLILSKKFSKNKKGNLTDRQVEAAKIIYNSGNGLLNMINEILDLSKIEAGKLSINVEKVKLKHIKKNMFDMFRHILKEKNIDFNINIEPSLGKYIITDKQKLEQILKNLLSNASKFTERGSISLSIKEVKEKIDFEAIDRNPSDFIEFSVLDTGIGISEDKHLDVFEAFQQADGTTSRKYGGTGLGLSITRELSRLLGGDIKLESSLGNGAKFRVFLPKESENKEFTKNKYKNLTIAESTVENTKLPMLKLKNRDSEFEEEPSKKRPVKQSNDERVFPTINDDRHNLDKTKHRVLIIEDDLSFAKILYDFCNERDFQCIHASDGQKGLDYAKEFEPDAIILDINLPKINGREVLEELKTDAKTKNIPVQIMSGNENMKNDFNENTVGFLTKPVKTN